MRSPSSRRTLLSLSTLLGLSIFAAGCNRIYSYSADPTRTARFDPVSNAIANVPPGGAGTQGVPSAEVRYAEPGATPQAAARQMVYSARFDVAASNPEEAMGQFIRGAQNAGGYLESRDDTRVVCRVPAASFQELVAGMPALGSIVSQAIHSDDVTRQYHDLKLRIDTAEWSRRRVLGLLDKADKIEDVIRLEEELLKLTTAIESLKGELESLSEQIAYSRIEVVFRSRATESPLGRPDAASPFAWINRVGAEQVLADFGAVESSDSPGGSGLVSLFSGGISSGPLDGFLIVASDRGELKAITPDASKLWGREFAVPQRANLDFWYKALRGDLIDHRGYRVIQERPVKDGKGNEGMELICDVMSQGQAHRYLVVVYAVDGPFWQRGSSVRTIEFVAPTATFEKCAAVVRQAFAGPGK
jgi:hypothetical protein